MELTALIQDPEFELLQGTTDKDVKALIYYSEKACPDCVFFAVPGSRSNGLDYINKTTALGASTLVVEDFCVGEFSEICENITVLKVANVRKAMAAMSCVFYGNPCKNLITIGVTGTKGKTTTAFMIQAILEAAGIKTGIIGTVKNGFEGHYIEATNTTPQSVDLQRMCREMVLGGCKAVVMEVSSQGLMQQRVAGIDFDFGVFTNISPDHIGSSEHENFEEYLYWKSTLFQHCKTAVLNIDDVRWQSVFKGSTAEKVVTFGTSPAADYRLKSQGGFNQMNSMAATAVASEMGISRDLIEKTLENVTVPGRFEFVPLSSEFKVVLDYAHTGDELATILGELRAYKPNRLVVIFGCGGNRDRNRRYAMGKAAAELADFSVVTSDNPRWEDPLKIIEDITTTLNSYNGKYTVIADRKEAIEYAIKNALSGDIILVAGKGHENYQIIGDEKIYLDDRETILSTDVNRG